MAIPLKLEYGPFFLSDLEEACGWYDTHSESSLGERLYREVLKRLHLLSLYPKAFPDFEHSKKGLRKCVLETFPYIILYKIVGPDTVLLVALAHAKREPKRWDKR